MKISCDSGTLVIQGEGAQLNFSQDSDSVSTLKARAQFQLKKVSIGHVYLPPLKVMSSVLNVGS